MPSPEPSRPAWRFLYGAFGLCGMTWLLYGTQTATYDLVVTGKAVFADARSISQVSLRSAHPVRRWLNQHGWLLPSAYTLELDANAQEVLGVRTWARKDGAWLIQAGTRAGRLPVTLWRHHGDEKYFITQDEIRYGHNHADRDEDGLPDIIELRTENARAAFSSWLSPTPLIWSVRRIVALMLFSSERSIWLEDRVRLCISGAVVSCTCC